MISKRSSGILAHISSLPSPYGIGDIGYSSYDFLSFLKESEQSFWQFLPIVATDAVFDHSPYMSCSAFAGNPLFISLELLFESGLIDRDSLQPPSSFSPYLVDFQAVKAFKDKLLEEATTRLALAEPDDFQPFRESNPWLDDYALYMVAKEQFAGSSWSQWPGEIRNRDRTALDNLRDRNRIRFNHYLFEQYLFAKQWQALKKRAADLSIHLFGDLPFYVSYDSADVWANQVLFLLNATSKIPTEVAGVPPDYFSKTGQRWGNPLYNWTSKKKNIRESLLEWWSKRLRHTFSQMDLVRIDHFRAFESYWSIPEYEKTAINGKWVKGPGAFFFKEMEKRAGKLNIVAEDLGIVTEEVTRLRDDLQFPGMKVLQFAFDGNRDNPFLPHNFTSDNCVVYTGTHDNDTTLGWFLSDAVNDEQRTLIKNLVNSGLNDQKPIHHDMIYLAQSSIAGLCILPLQDILGFGNDCRMNRPGIAEGNWRWRCAPQFLTEEVKNYLKRGTTLFNRSRNRL
ncbi:4-alpha-glucanotransferase [Desulforhopalus singaporensis]|uniref:4-alpha-glucanotransferase n=1 Tax=Desulforhopalus singaporensis TaxID=91360 RepID=A0A1H0PC34_9BACT|nr:4-alpha-glucanotransferase [Desulforhopalus singaporensis]SDP02320.1 4-alpha-glucanotransferase [Desulforhopalus singaporensis]